ncbi:hypothetical protein ACTXT7_016242 [Hymenolepis weldensis]
MNAKTSSWTHINPASCVRREIPAEVLMDGKLRMLREAMLPKITLPDNQVLVLSRASRTRLKLSRLQVDPSSKIHG